MLNHNECYNILELPLGASDDDIKKAYKKLSFQYHADRNPGNEEAKEKFLKVQEAYQTLTGKIKDKPSHQQQQDPDFPFDPFEGFNFDFSRFGFPPPVGNQQQQQQYFRQEQERPPNEDSSVRVNIQSNVEEIKAEKHYRIKFTKSEDCKECGGIGGKSSSSCDECRGFGVVHKVFRGQGFYSTQTMPCTKCLGCGKIIQDVCVKCESKGYTTKEERLHFSFKIEKEEGE